jgi:hypothetical protein
MRCGNDPDADPLSANGTDSGELAGLPTGLPMGLAAGLVTAAAARLLMCPLDDDDEGDLFAGDGCVEANPLSFEFLDLTPVVPAEDAGVRLAKALGTRYAFWPTVMTGADEASFVVVVTAAGGAVLRGDVALATGAGAGSRPAMAAGTR